MSASLDPHEVLDRAIIRNFVVAASQTVKGGFEVVFASDDQEIDDAGANSAAGIGVARGIEKTYTAGQRVEVVVSNAIVPMKVGTAGVTRGLEVVQAASGIEDAAAANGGGSTVAWIVGRAMQTGVANDYVGVLLHKSFRITT